MNWSTDHTLSEELASRAHAAARLGDEAGAKQLFEKAAEAESSALNSVKIDKSRTYGITAVSAASLWYKAENYARARQTITSALAKKNLPEFAAEQLRELRSSIDEAESIISRNVAWYRDKTFVPLATAVGLVCASVIVAVAVISEDALTGHVHFLLLFAQLVAVIGNMAAVVFPLLRKGRSRSQSDD